MNTHQQSDSNETMENRGLFQPGEIVACGERRGSGRQNSFLGELFHSQEQRGALRECSGDDTVLAQLGDLRQRFFDFGGAVALEI
jgi:hypothetical protein